MRELAGGEVKHGQRMGEKRICRSGYYASPRFRYTQPYDGCLPARKP
jgi:hypothetical protein